MNGLSPRPGIHPSRQPRIAGHFTRVSWMAMLGAWAALRGARTIPAHRQPHRRPADWGGLAIAAHSGYNFTPIKLFGETAYTDFAKRPPLGRRIRLPPVSTSSQDSTVRETTFEIGPARLRDPWPHHPYAGDLLRPRRLQLQPTASPSGIPPTTSDVVGGADSSGSPTRLQCPRRLTNTRTGLGFPLGTLHPSVITIGAAYHFPQGQAPLTGGHARRKRATS